MSRIRSYETNDDVPKKNDKIAKLCGLQGSCIMWPSIIRPAEIESHERKSHLRRTH